jgi:thymidylate synthase
VPSVIQLPDLRNGYVELVELVRNEGRITSPRGMETAELLDVILELKDPRDSLPVGVGRGLHLPIALAEAAQVVGATSNPRLLVRVAPGFQQFREPDGTFYGSYGRRIGTQLFHVVHKLEEDPDTRQAVITLWNPKLDNELGHLDYPCTVMLQFLVRDGKLILHVTMRSNDVWLGVAYDVFMFTQLQLSVAKALGIPTGPYHHHAVSLHMYARDREAADQLHRVRGRRPPAGELDGFGRSGDGIATIVQRAHSVALGNGHLLEDPTPTEVAYTQGLAEPRSDDDGDTDSGA